MSSTEIFSDPVQAQDITVRPSSNAELHEMNLIAINILVDPNESNSTDRSNMEHNSSNQIKSRKNESLNHAISHVLFI